MTRSRIQASWTLRYAGPVIIRDGFRLIFLLLSPLFGQADRVRGMRAKQRRETNVLPWPSFDLEQPRCLVVKLHCVIVWCTL